MRFVSRVGWLRWSAGGCVVIARPVVEARVFVRFLSVRGRLDSVKWVTGRSACPATPGADRGEWVTADAVGWFDDGWGHAESWHLRPPLCAASEWVLANLPARGWVRIEYRTGTRAAVCENRNLGTTQI